MTIPSACGILKAAGQSKHWKDIPRLKSTALPFSPDGATLASASDDNTVRFCEGYRKQADCNAKQWKDIGYSVQQRRL